MLIATGRRRWWIAGAAAAVLLVAVAGFALVRSTSSSSYAGGGDVDAVVEGWVRAVGGSTSEAIEPAIGTSAPGSPAFLYANHRAATITAAQDYGFDTSSYATEVTTNGDGSYRWCVSSQSERACHTVDDVDVDAAGKLVSMSIDGLPLADRIVGGGQPVEMPGGGTAQLLSGYESIDGELLYAVVEFEAGDVDLRIPYRAAVFVGADGSQLANVPEKRIDPPPGVDLLAGERSVVVYGFQGATLPGRLVLEDVCDGASSTCTTVDLPVG